jgi:hypothetical protein
MRTRHAQEKGIEWRWADVRDMSDVAADSVDVAFDKGTLDAMIHGSPWSPPDQVLSDTSRYMREVGRAFVPSSFFAFYFIFLCAEVLRFLLCDGRFIAFSSLTGFSCTSRSGSRISLNRCCRLGTRSCGIWR